MQKYEITWFGDNEDIKFFKTKNSRIVLIDFQKEDLLKAEELFNEVKFSSGVYILEGSKEENDDLQKRIYVGESDNVWKRVKTHIDGKSQIKNIDFIERVSVILSTDSFDEFTKTEIHWIEKELLDEFNSLPNITIVNDNIKSNKIVSILKEKLLKIDLDYIKKALYLIGKDYFIKSIEDNASETETSDLDTNWVKVSPISRKKRNVEINNSKFEYNILTKVIKVHKGTTIRGIVKGAQVNFEKLNYFLEKYKSKGYFEGKFNPATSQYNITVIKDLQVKPSTLTLFTRAGVSNGWVFWKNKDGDLIDKYRKNVSEESQESKTKS